MSSPLGFIPAWQFSADPKVNPFVNPHVTMPEGRYQAGVFSDQPNLGGLGGAHVAGPRMNVLATPPLCYKGGSGLSCAPKGLGYVMIDEPDGMPMVTMKRVAQQAGLGLPIDNPFDSFAWRNRKLLTVAGLGVVGLALFSVVSSVLK